MGGRPWPLGAEQARPCLNWGALAQGCWQWRQSTAPIGAAGLRTIDAAADQPLVDQPLAAGQGKGGGVVVAQLVVITPTNLGR